MARCAKLLPGVEGLRHAMAVMLHGSRDNVIKLMSYNPPQRPSILVLSDNSQQFAQPVTKDFSERQHLAGIHFGEAQSRMAIATGEFVLVCRGPARTAKANHRDPLITLRAAVFR